MHLFSVFYSWIWKKKTCLVGYCWSVLLVLQCHKHCICKCTGAVWCSLCNICAASGHNYGTREVYLYCLAVLVLWLSAVGTALMDMYLVAKRNMQHTRGICMWFSPIFNNYALNRSYICMLGLIRMKYHQTPETLIDFLFFPHSLETSDDSGGDFYSSCPAFVRQHINERQRWEMLEKRELKDMERHLRSIDFWVLEWFLRHI